jgi:hypothetical protein
MADAAGEHEQLMNEIAGVLHDMCQPLTALQFRLEIGQINETATASDGVSAILTDCLCECERLNKTVATMRGLVQQVRANEQRSER